MSKQLQKLAIDIARKKLPKATVKHAMRVASNFSKGSKEYLVAVLHDVVEDTEITVEEISELFGEEIAGYVDYLTKYDNETYFDYVKRVKRGGKIVRAVKLADLRDNMTRTDWKGYHPDSVDGTTPPSLLKRYQKAVDMLT